MKSKGKMLVGAFVLMLACSNSMFGCPRITGIRISPSSSIALGRSAQATMTVYNPDASVYSITSYSWSGAFSGSALSSGTITPVNVGTYTAIAGISYTSTNGGGGTDSKSIPFSVYDWSIAPTAVTASGKQATATFSVNPGVIKLDRVNIGKISTGKVSYTFNQGSGDIKVTGYVGNVSRTATLQRVMHSRQASGSASIPWTSWFYGGVGQFTLNTTEIYNTYKYNVPATGNLILGTSSTATPEDIMVSCNANHYYNSDTKNQQNMPMSKGNTISVNTNVWIPVQSTGTVNPTTAAIESEDPPGNFVAKCKANVTVNLLFY